MEYNDILIPKSLTLLDIKSIIYYKLNLKLDSKSVLKIKESRSIVESITNQTEPVYGINTGFGKLATKFIEKPDLEHLQMNLIRSHTAGTGEELDGEIVKVALLLLTNSLTRGFSGVRLELINKLISLFNSEYIPVVPKYGSLGASGDLIPLAHMVSSLIDEYPVRNAAGDKLIKISDGDPDLVLRSGLKAKEGLALINGTHFTTAITGVSLIKIVQNIQYSFLAFSLSMDAMLASLKPFSEVLHDIRPHQGQIWTAKLIRTMLNDSELVESHKDPVNDPRVQDPYSYRCFPQVMGGIIQTILNAKEVIETEMKSVTDNPLVFSEIQEIISGGNFHAEPIALIADYLAIAMTNLMGIMEKQIEKLLNPVHNHDLPPFLTPNPGLNSGYMIAHFTQAALLNRAILLSKPSSVDNISTSANQEDFVSMGMNAALKLFEINELLTDFLSYYFLIASQALELRKEQTGKLSSSANETILKNIRNYIPKLDNDRQIEPDLKIMKNLLINNILMDKLVFKELNEFENWILG